MKIRLRVFIFSFSFDIVVDYWFVDKVDCYILIFIWKLRGFNFKKIELNRWIFFCNLLKICLELNIVKMEVGFFIMEDG